MKQCHCAVLAGKARQPDREDIAWMQSWEVWQRGRAKRRGWEVKLCGFAVLVGSDDGTMKVELWSSDGVQCLQARPDREDIAGRIRRH